MYQLTMCRSGKFVLQPALKAQHGSAGRLCYLTNQMTLQSLTILTVRLISNRL